MFTSRYNPCPRMRNVQRVRRALCDGRCNYHHYHRPTRTKLPGEPGSPEFMAVYEECERQLAAGLRHKRSRTTVCQPTSCRLPEWATTLASQVAQAPPPDREPGWYWLT